MKNLSESFCLSDHPRRDRNADNRTGIFGDYNETNFEDSEHCTIGFVCDESAVKSNGAGFGYGSIDLYRSSSNPFSGEALHGGFEMEKRVSFEVLGCKNEYDNIDNEFRGKNSYVARWQRHLSRMAWMVMMVIIFCFYLGLELQHNTGTSYTTDETRITGPTKAFYFDSVFGGGRKHSSMDTLERPTPIARSILLVLRAEVTPSNPIVLDMDRMLTAKGMQDSEGLGVYLQQHNIPEPDWIFVSPSERTAYTTELMRRHWASNVPVAFEQILYTLAFNDYFSFVAGLNDQFRRVMIVGHNPAILNTAKKLMKTHGIEEFPDCGLMEIRWNDLAQWKKVEPYSGSAKMAIDPNHNFFFSSPR